MAEIGRQRDKEIARQDKQKKSWSEGEREKERRERARHEKDKRRVGQEKSPMSTKRTQQQENM